MHKKEALLLSIIFFILLVTPVYAKSMTLLAVSQTKDGLVGTTADLELEIKTGTGRVFISTFPLTNVDTQISFRMAEEYACDFLDRDCNNYDFYYVIRSDSPIIGGPSAGGAATLLTISTLDNLNIDPKIAATGTINSGGIIGPVAGVKQKIEAASKAGLKKVLIPIGTRYYRESNLDIAQKIIEGQVSNLTAGQLLNTTIDLVEYGNTKNIEVQEIEDITQAIFELTGKKYKQFDENIEIDQKYQEIMKKISEDLCGRSRTLMGEIAGNTEELYLGTLDSAKNLTDSGADAYNNGLYYSAASYCYSANVKYDYIFLLSSNLTREQIIQKLDTVENESNTLSSKLDSFDYKSIDDMQTFLVVKERLTDAQYYTEESRKQLPSSTPNSIYSLALAIERLNSAYSWSEFFGKGGKAFNIGEDTLTRFCLDKISEADERIQYISSFILLPMDSLKTELDSATTDYQNKNYELCIFTASKVKARTNLILTSMGLRDEDFERVLARKIEIARSAIVKETKRQIFPLLGYSYYEYAKSLQKDDPGSAMLYAELSLELSNFDMYFRPTQGQAGFSIDTRFIIIFSGGAIAGFLISSLLYFLVVHRIGLKKGPKQGSSPKKQRTKG